MSKWPSCLLVVITGWLHSTNVCLKSCSPSHTILIPCIAPIFCLDQLEFTLLAIITSAPDVTLALPCHCLKLTNLFTNMASYSLTFHCLISCHFFYHFTSFPTIPFLSNTALVIHQLTDTFIMDYLYVPVACIQSGLPLIGDGIIPTTQNPVFCALF
jgi:hypothetical protein